MGKRDLLEYWGAYANPISNFNGWVVAAELTEASWQHEGENHLVFSIHAPGGQGAMLVK